MSDKHRVVLEFDDGVYAKLICPGDGSCTGSSWCGHCGRDYHDPDSTPCYDCKGVDPDECWVKTWFDNCTADELLAGRLEVGIDAQWEHDHMVAHVVAPVAALQGEEVSR